jgi:hypothetical protein
MRAVVRALHDAIEAKTIGASHQFDIVVQMLSHVAGRVLAADNQTELHCSASFVVPLLARATYHDDRISTTS